MVTNLSPGDKIRIGGSVILTVLAVEGDLIRFGLETSQEVNPGTGNGGKDGEETDRKYRPNGWELN